MRFYKLFLLIDDQIEMMIYYQDSSLASLQVSAIEDMDLTQLKQTAQNQREALYDAHPLNKKFNRLSFRKY